MTETEVETNRADSDCQAGDQRYRHLFENLPICILTVNLTVTPAVILDANRRAGVVYGYSVDKFVGIPATQLVPEDSREGALDILQRVQKGETVTTEINNQHRDGTIFPVQVVATLDPNISGHMIIATRDIGVESARRTEVQAIEAERLRIAQEIHDSVAQNLAALRLKLGLWKELASGAPQEMRAALNEMQDVLTVTIADIRRAIFALRPVDLEELGLLPALTQLVTAFEDQYQVSVSIEVSGHQGVLPRPYELTLYRIIQEGLNNVGKHAGASSVGVHLMLDEVGGVTLTVRDNGRGFDPGLGGTETDHFGLRQMRERILQQEGTLDIQSTIGKGTELIVKLPPHTKGFNNVPD